MNRCGRWIGIRPGSSPIVRERLARPSEDQARRTEYCTEVRALLPHRTPGTGASRPIRRRGPRRRRRRRRRITTVRDGRRRLAEGLPKDPRPSDAAPLTVSAFVSRSHVGLMYGCTSVHPYLCLHRRTEPKLNGARPGRTFARKTRRRRRRELPRSTPLAWTTTLKRHRLRPKLGMTRITSISISILGRAT